MSQETKNKRMDLLIEPSTYDVLKQHQKDTGMSMAEFIRRSVQERLERISAKG